MKAMWPFGIVVLVCVLALVSPMLAAGFWCGGFIWMGISDLEKANSIENESARSQARLMAKIWIGMGVMGIVGFYFLSRGAH